MHRSGRPTAAGLALVLALSLSSRSPLARQSSLPARGEPLAADRVDGIMTRFFAAADEYLDVYKNLSAGETKTIDIVDDAGKVTRTRQIVSDLVVYRATHGGTAATTEFRDVREVDGKAVNHRGDRALKLLTDATRAKSLEKELQIINNETRKYEQHSHWLNPTLSQGWVTRRWREFFAFELSGRDSIDGHEVVVVSFRQTAAIPGLANASLPKQFPTQPMLKRGRMWLDAQTAQLWREEVDFTVRHPSLTAPLVRIRFDNTYVPSQFGIHVPQRLVFEVFGTFHQPKNGAAVLLLSERTTCSYGPFKRFGVTTDEEYQAPATAPGSPSR